MLHQVFVHDANEILNSALNTLNTRSVKSILAYYFINNVLIKLQEMS